MKKTFHLLLFWFFSQISFAQGGGFNYKALISDNGNVLANHSVTFKFTVLENGTTAVYQETQSATTDANGIVAVNVGEGTVASGNFTMIDWGSNPYFLKVEIDTGTGYQDFGTTAFKAVPYAKYAEKAGNTFSGNFSDLTNVPTGLSDGDDDTHLTDAQIAAMGYIKNANDADHDVNNELQNLTLTGTQLSISNGNHVDFTNWDTNVNDDVQAINDLSDAKTTDYGMYLGNNSGTNANAQGDLVAVGREVMPNAGSADYSVGIGNFALNSLTSGSYNVAIGYGAGEHLTTNGYNVLVGYRAGRFATGYRNVFIGYQAGKDETGNEKLYIDNSSTPNPLIYGDFSTNELTINGSLAIKDGTQASGNVFVSDANGKGHWSNDLPKQSKVLLLGSLNATVAYGSLFQSLVTSPSSGAYLTNTSTGNGIIIPINLPQDAHITGARVYFKDNTTNNYLIQIIKKEFTSYGTIVLGNYTTSGASTSVRNHYFSLNEPINPSYQYYLWMGPPDSSNHWTGSSYSAFRALSIYYSE